MQCFNWFKDKQLHNASVRETIRDSLSIVFSQTTNFVLANIRTSYGLFCAALGCLLLEFLLQLNTLDVWMIWLGTTPNFATHRALYKLNLLVLYTNLFALIFPLLKVL